MRRNLIVIRPYRGLWEVCEGCGIQPLHLSLEAAISDARSRLCGREGEIRVEDKFGTIVETITDSDLVEV